MDFDVQSPLRGVVSNELGASTNVSLALTNVLYRAVPWRGAAWHGAAQRGWWMGA